jgi:hypothetical protein
VARLVWRAAEASGEVVAVGAPAPPSRGAVESAMTVTGWRSAHDLGLAAWFGGSLMGAVGLNQAAVPEKEVSAERVAFWGWARWTPVNAAAIAVHLGGGAAILASNAHRVAGQKGVAASTIAKSVVTAAALAATGYSRVLGKKVELASSGSPDDAEKHPVDLEAARRAVPGLTGLLVVLNALHGEQQRPAEQAAGFAERVRSLIRG